MWGQAPPGREVAELPPFAQAAAGTPGARADDLELGGAAGGRRSLHERAGTQDPGHGHGCDLHRRYREEPAERSIEGAGGRGLACSGQRHICRHGRAVERRPGAGHRLHAAGGVAAAGAWPLSGGVVVPVAAGLSAERRGAALDLPAAQPGRGEDQQAATQLLRQAEPRRAPQPGDQ